MLKRIKQLEQASTSLEPPAKCRQQMTRQAVSYAESFLTDLPTMNTFERNMGRSGGLDQPFIKRRGIFQYCWKR